MRILITGASGNAGRGMTDILRKKHDLVLHDLTPNRTDLPFYQGDLQVGGNLLPACEGCDVVIHTAAYHGIHAHEKDELDYWRLNVDGTYHVFQAAARQGVKKVVYLSSVAYYDHYDKYGFTKVVGEEICEYFWRSHRMSYIALRPGDFTPWDSFLTYGPYLLRGGVDRRDVLECIRLAVEDSEVTNDWFEVQSNHPFTDEELEEWDHDPWRVVERYFNGARALGEKYQVSLKRKPKKKDIQKTTDALGWRPRHTFLSFLEELREMDVRGETLLPICIY